MTVGKDAAMMQAISIFHPFSTTEDEVLMPVQGQQMQRIDLVRRTMRDFGHLLDNDTRNRVMAEIIRVSGKQ